MRVPQINLYLINLLKYLPGVGSGVVLKCLKVFTVLRFMWLQVAFNACDLNVDLCNPNLHVHPDRDDGDQEGKQANGLGERETE